MPNAIRLLADVIPQIVWAARPDGFLDYYNQQWFDYTGLTLEQTQGWGWEAALHPDDLQLCLDRWTAAVATGEPYEVEYRFKRASDGTYRWHLGRALPVRDESGNITYWVGTCTDIDDQKQAERLMAARAEREQLVNRISLAIRGTLDPAAIQATVVSALGEALNADRCCFVSYDLPRDRILVGSDWHRPDLPPLASEYRASQNETLRRELYGAGTTAVIADAQASLSAPSAAILTQFRQRAILGVPLYDRGRLVAALSAAMADEPRAWTADEVALMEEVATLTRSATEAARVHQRERHIAETLQGALQPALPNSIPGLDLASFYLPALDEASVGGDFVDVFPVEKGCYALVVGDLSGKGLDAAAQVATVRNMLRYALYTGQTLAEAVTRLNSVLILNDLLIGFATLVIVVYDVERKTLTYISCGQEPALLRRTPDGHVEELPPTGPILGASESARYEETVLQLAPGDAFALYTDGLTEAGPNRRQMLGVDGLARLFAGPEGRAEELVARTMAGVEAYAGGAFHDDICLLVGVVKPDGAQQRKNLWMP